MYYLPERLQAFQAVPATRVPDYRTSDSRVSQTTELQIKIVPVYRNFIMVGPPGRRPYDSPESSSGQEQETKEKFKKLLKCLQQHSH